jgi:hypothetical protein
VDDQTFKTRFSQLMDKIKDLPEGERNRFQQLAEQTRLRRERIQASVGELQESLDYLRLSIKYLVFDLEATRRENAYLRKLVEQANRNDQRKPRPGKDNFLGDQGSGAD